MYGYFGVSSPSESQATIISNNSNTNRRSSNSNNNVMSRNRANSNGGTSKNWSWTWAVTVWNLQRINIGNDGILLNNNGTSSTNSSNQGSVKTTGSASRTSTTSSLKGWSNGNARESGRNSGNMHVTFSFEQWGSDSPDTMSMASPTPDQTCTSPVCWTADNPYVGTRDVIRCLKPWVSSCFCDCCVPPEVWWAQQKEIEQQKKQIWWTSWFSNSSFDTWPNMAWKWNSAPMANSGNVNMFSINGSPSGQQSGNKNVNIVSPSNKAIWTNPQVSPRQNQWQLSPWRGLSPRADLSPSDQEQDWVNIKSQNFLSIARKKMSKDFELQLNVVQKESDEFDILKKIMKPKKGVGGIDMLFLPSVAPPWQQWGWASWANSGFRQNSKKRTKMSQNFCLHNDLRLAEAWKIDHGALRMSYNAALSRIGVYDYNITHKRNLQNPWYMQAEQKAQDRRDELEWAERGIPVEKLERNMNKPLGVGGHSQTLSTMSTISGWSIMSQREKDHFGQDVHNVFPRLTTLIQEDSRDLDELNEDLNEVFLMHGSSPENILKIISGNVNERFSGSGVGWAFGSGIYFAEDSAKADQYWRPDPGYMGSNPLMDWKLQKQRRLQKSSSSSSIDLSVNSSEGLYKTKSDDSSDNSKRDKPWGLKSYQVEETDAPDRQVHIDPNIKELHTRIFDKCSVQHPGDIFYVLIFRVIMGYYQTTTRYIPKTVRELDEIPGTVPTILHHGLVADLRFNKKKNRRHRFREFIQFHGERTYPQYLLAYQRVFRDPNVARQESEAKRQKINYPDLPLVDQAIKDQLQQQQLLLTAVTGALLDSGWAGASNQGQLQDVDMAVADSSQQWVNFNQAQNAQQNYNTQQQGQQQGETWGSFGWWVGAGEGSAPGAMNNNNLTIDELPNVAMVSPWSMNEDGSPMPSPRSQYKRAQSTYKVISTVGGQIRKPTHQLVAEANAKYWAEQWWQSRQSVPPMRESLNKKSRSSSKNSSRQTSAGTSGTRESVSTRAHSNTLEHQYTWESWAFSGMASEDIFGGDDRWIPQQNGNMQQAYQNQRLNSPRGNGTNGNTYNSPRDNALATFVDEGAIVIAHQWDQQENADIINNNNGDWSPGWSSDGSSSGFNAWEDQLFMAQLLWEGGASDDQGSGSPSDWLYQQTRLLSQQNNNNKRKRSNSKYDLEWGGTLLDDEDSPNGNGGLLGHSSSGLQSGYQVKKSVAAQMSTLMWVIAITGVVIWVVVVLIVLYCCIEYNNEEQKKGTGTQKANTNSTTKELTEEERKMMIDEMDMEMNEERNRRSRGLDKDDENQPVYEQVLQADTVPWDKVSIWEKTNITLCQHDKTGELNRYWKNGVLSNTWFPINDGEAEKCLYCAWKYLRIQDISIPKAARYLMLDGGGEDNNDQHDQIKDKASGKEDSNTINSWQSSESVSVKLNSTDTGTGTTLRSATGPVNVTKEELKKVLDKNADLTEKQALVIIQQWLVEQQEKDELDKWKKWGKEDDNKAVNVNPNSKQQRCLCVFDIDLTLVTPEKSIWDAMVTGNNSTLNTNIDPLNTTTKYMHNGPGHKLPGQVCRDYGCEVGIISNFWNPYYPAYGPMSLEYWQAGEEVQKEIQQWQAAEIQKELRNKGTNTSSSTADTDTSSGKASSASSSPNEQTPAAQAESEKQLQSAKASASIQITSENLDILRRKLDHSESLNEQIDQANNSPADGEGGGDKTGTTEKPIVWLHHGTVLQYVQWKLRDESIEQKGPKYINPCLQRGVNNTCLSWYSATTALGLGTQDILFYTYTYDDYRFKFNNQDQGRLIRAYWEKCYGRELDPEWDSSKESYGPYGQGDSQSYNQKASGSDYLKAKWSAGSQFQISSDSPVSYLRAKSAGHGDHSEEGHGQWHSHGEEKGKEQEGTTDTWIKVPETTVLKNNKLVVMVFSHNQESIVERWNEWGMCGINVSNNPKLRFADNGAPDNKPGATGHIVKLALEKYVVNADKNPHCGQQMNTTSTQTSNDGTQQDMNMNQVQLYPKDKQYADVFKGEQEFGHVKLKNGQEYVQYWTSRNTWPVQCQLFPWFKFHRYKPFLKILEEREWEQQQKKEAWDRDKKKQDEKAKGDGGEGDDTDGKSDDGNSNKKDVAQQVSDNINNNDGDSSGGPENSDLPPANSSNTPQIMRLSVEAAYGNADGSHEMSFLTCDTFLHMPYDQLHM